MTRPAVSRSLERRSERRAERLWSESPLRRVLLLAVSSFALTGCFLWTTRGEGNDLEERAAGLDERVATLEQAAENQRQEIKARLGKATQVATRNSADLGLEVQRLQEEIGRLEGQNAELRNQISQQQTEIQEERAETQRRLQLLSQKVGLDVELEPSDIPRDREEHYATAYRAFRANEHSRARALFRAYVERYPQDAEVDNATYWIGKTYLAQDRPATALGEFRQVLSEHSEGDAVDETLLDMAEAFYRLNACDDARDALEALVRSQSRSNLVPQARRKLQQIRRAPRGYCRD